MLSDHLTQVRINFPAVGKLGTNGQIHTLSALQVSETCNLRRYNFKSDPRDLGAVVVLSVDESTYSGMSLFSLRFIVWTFEIYSPLSDTGTRRFNQGTPHPTGK